MKGFQRIRTIESHMAQENGLLLNCFQPDKLHYFFAEYVSLVLIIPGI